eukprot:6209722-Pyramimonas_sp.AAC.1
MVAAWARAYQPSIAQWKSSLVDEGVDTGQLTATSPIFSGPVDLAVCQYADDLLRLHVALSSDPLAEL